MRAPWSKPPQPGRFEALAAHRRRLILIGAALTLFVGGAGTWARKRGGHSEVEDSGPSGGLDEAPVSEDAA